MLRFLHGKYFIRQLSRGTTTNVLLRGGTKTWNQSRRQPIRYDVQQRRGLGGIPTVLLPPVVFGGLVVALWTWKCFMMVAFQNKIIYMPGLPPNARRETIAHYKNQCGGIQWWEERIRSLDGTRISLCVASVNDSGNVPAGRTVYVLYFQGNASSIPPRLPFLSPVLRMLSDMSPAPPVTYIMVCCSYRGYWTSKGRPSEKGIAMDAAASLEWVRKDFLRRGGNPAEDTPVIIWGQSIGAGVATSLAAQQHFFSRRDVSLKMLIIETPFVSVRAMLETLYPQKWLPYRHLWPFLRNHLDSFKALGMIQESFNAAGIKTPKVLILEAGKDELVPKDHSDILERRCVEVGLDVTKKTIGGALHTEVMVRPEGRLAVVEAIKSVGRSVVTPQSRVSE